MAEKSFADYVKDVMASLPQVSSPMFSGSSMTPEEVAAYRANPFYRQEEIRKRIAAEEAAKATPVTPATPMAMGGGGSVEPPMSPATLAFLEAENSGDRGYRNQQLINLITKSGPASMTGLLGLTDQFGNPSGARMVQQAAQGNPAMQQLMADVVGRYGTKPGSQQTAMLMAQEAGMFDTPFSGLNTVGVSPMSMAQAEADARGEGGYPSGGGEAYSSDPIGGGYVGGDTGMGLI